MFPDFPKNNMCFSGKSNNPEFFSKKTNGTKIADVFNIRCGIIIHKQ